MARQSGKRTTAIRELLDKNPELTYREGGKEALEKQGFSEGAKDKEMRIDENKYNVTKHMYLKAKAGGKVAKATKTKTKRGRKPAVVATGDDLGRSVAVLKKHGGLTAAKELIVELTNAVMSFENAQEVMAAAS